MDNEPTNWFCDTCGEVINNAEEGWLEWIHDYRGDGKHHSFRITHHSSYSPLNKDHQGEGCYKYGNTPGRMDNHLDIFLGSKGLVYLMSKLDVGPLHQPTEKEPGVRSIREWCEIVRRLHLPYYEEARRYWALAKEDGFFDEANEVWIYSPETLKKIIDKYGKN